MYRASTDGLRQLVELRLHGRGQLSQLLLLLRLHRGVGGTS
jgi:hypothetical protein